MNSCKLRTTPALFCFVVAFAPILAGQTLLSFSQGLNFPGGPALVAADFNNDGKLDIATGTSVLLGKGDGTFQPPWSTSVSGLRAITADFNNDGKADLVIAGYSTPSSTTVLLTVLLGNGDGTFRPLPPIDMGVSVGFDLAQADANNDGKADLFVVVAGTVFVLMGRGDGTFASPVQYGTGSNPASSVLAADVNGDRYVDLVVGSAGFISVLLGNGNGTFKPPLISAGGDLLAVGDVNEDGKIDLIVQNKPTNILQSPQDYIQLGNGDGTFQSMTNPLPFAGPVALWDFNGDGKLDLVIQNTYPVGGSPFASMFLGVGNGTFTHQHDYLLHLDGSNSSNIVIADFNNDGIPDIAMDGSLLLGKSNLNFASPPALAFSNDVSSVLVGDFNNDGYPDTAVQTGTALTIALGDGSGALMPAHSYATSQVTLSLATADLNSDGNLDLVGVVASSSPAGWNIAAELGAGDGGFVLPLVSPGGSGMPMLGDIVLGDFNNDGKADIVLAETPLSGVGLSSLLLLLGNGDGTFAAPVAIPGTVAGYVISGDFNGDGKLDLATADSAGVSILKGNGDGTFQSPVFVSFTSSQRLAAADINGDGRLDLIATGTNTYVLLGNGDGTFHAAPTLNVSGVTLIGDLNGDGRPDLVLNGPAGSEIDVLLGNGDGTFASPIKVMSSRFDLAPVAVADLNRDSLEDLVLSLSPYAAIVEFPYGGVFTLLNTTPPDFMTTVTPTAISVAAPGQSATAKVTIRSIGSFAGAVSLSCSISSSSGAASPTCSLSSATVSVGPTKHSAMVTMTIATNSAMMDLAARERRFFATTASGISMLLVIVGIVIPSKTRRKYSYAGLSMVLLLMFLSCGGGRSGDSGSSSTSYTVTVKASSGSISHTATVSMTLP